MSKIMDLEKRINDARHAYYNSDKPIMSDQAFDVLVDQLYKLDPKNPAIIGVGSEPVSNWEKFAHKVEMGSLNKCQTAEEYIEWHNKYISPNDKAFVTTKLDGLSISLIYENGKLVQAASRGSGSIGELITSNVVRMQNVPLKLNKKINATIRGEILLSKENLDKFFPDYSNSRNAASGISRRYDGSGSDKLSVLVYELKSDDVLMSSQEDQFQLLNSLGLKTPPYWIFSSAQEVLDFKTDYQNNLRNKFEYDLDGLVAHNNSLEVQELFGSLHGRPYASIAIKFDAVHKEAYVKDIIIQVGNSGRLTPVAVFEPKVNLMGAEVERASLHNFSNIANLGVDIGATVLICRSNDVIPFLSEVIVSTGSVFQPPSKCPVCGSNAVESGEYMQCPNVIDCPAQKSGRIKNWIKDLNVLEWGDALIDRLVEAGKVSSIVDLYKLSINDLASLERMGEKSAKKCHELLWQQTSLPLDLVLGALSIPMIGKSSIKLLIDNGHDTFDKIMNLSCQDIENVHGMGPARAKSLHDGLRYNYDLLIELFKYISIKEKVSGSLSGVRVAITGSTKMKRADLEKFISENGGEYKSSIGRTCTHLVIADINSTSGKAVSARKLGIKLISEDDFIKGLLW